MDRRTFITGISGLIAAACAPLPAIAAKTEGERIRAAAVNGYLDRVRLHIDRAPCILTGLGDIRIGVMTVVFGTTDGAEYLFKFGDGRVHIDQLFTTVLHGETVPVMMLEARQYKFSNSLEHRWSW